MFGNTFFGFLLMIESMLAGALLLPVISLLGASEALIRVDGNWSPWSTVKSYCVDPSARQNLVTCGGGVETKYRSCTNPAPQNGGANCIAEISPTGEEITTKKVIDGDIILY